MNKPTVFVGLSGGVDSSVSAALLKEAGFDVVGVFIKVWQPDWLPCNWREDRRDAMRICAHLDIPFLMFDFGDIYKKEVADYMISEYKKGRTPNPDIMCNKHIKFGAFLDKALGQGADMVATGHYARVEHNDLLRKSEIRNSKSETNSNVRNSKIKSVLDLKNLNLDIVSNFPGLAPRSGAGDIRASNLYQYQLLAGIDVTKDQSYFLWALTQDQLSRIIFPVGGYKKEEVRKLARKFGLPTAEKKDSQGICFLGKLDIKDFLKHYIPEKRGNVENERGEVIGWHPGAAYFTLGERHGFTITKKETQDPRYYVVDKDITKNTLTVSSYHLSHDRKISDKGVVDKKGERRVLISDVNWISDSPEIGKTYQARIRHLGKLHNCQVVSVNKGKATINFCHSSDVNYQLSNAYPVPSLKNSGTGVNCEPLASPGQSLVLYDGDLCLGGGIIS